MAQNRNDAMARRFATYPRREVRGLLLVKKLTSIDLVNQCFRAHCQLEAEWVAYDLRGVDLTEKVDSQGLLWDVDSHAERISNQAKGTLKLQGTNEKFWAP